MINTNDPSSDTTPASQQNILTGENQSWLMPPAKGFLLVSALMSLIMLIGLYTSGVLQGMDRALIDISQRVLERPVSGKIVIVAFDQESRTTLGVKEPTRNQHAELIGNLLSADVARIGFDFQLEHPSNTAADVSLTNALRAANGRVVLPMFSMTNNASSNWTMHHSPLDEFAKFADVGSSTLNTGPDGLVRNFKLIHTVRNTFIPSFAGTVTNSPEVHQTDFILDFSINPKNIKRYSYADILNNRVPQASLKDKIVFVGTTDDLNSNLPKVPIYGVLNAVEIQALASESLIQGRLLEMLPSPSVLALASFILILLSVVFLSINTISSALVGALSILTVVALGLIAQNYYQLVVPVASILIAIVLAFIVGTFARSNSKSQNLFISAFEARERSELMNAIINTNFDSIVVFDEQDRVYSLNPTGAKMLNWTVEGALGRARDAILRLPEDFADHQGEARAMETVITRADGNALDVELTITETVLAPSETKFERRQSSRVYRIYSFRDISERKKAESSMGDTAERAMQADRLKSEFIANMSHELRAPLNSIIGFSEVIKQELYGNIGNPQYKEYAKDIFLCGKHLMTIIDDLLEVSRIASGKVELTDTEIDMERMFAECLQIVRGYPNASKKVISASMRAGCPDLIADKRAVKQILINLLSNAVKFTKEGGSIRLSAAPSTEGGVEIMVSDDGIGIPATEMSRITDAFHQIDQSDHRKNSGTGLGLHIVQSLAQLHGGHIAVTSTVNSGTQVRVIFPPERNGTAPNVIPLEINKKSR